MYFSRFQQHNKLELTTAMVARVGNLTAQHLASQVTPLTLAGGLLGVTR